MVVVLVGPPLLAVGWWAVQSAIVPVQKQAADDFGPPQLEKAIAAYEEYLRTHP